MHKLMRSVLALVVAVLMVLFAVGCGGGATENADDSAAYSAAPAEPAAAAEDEEEETGDWRELQLDEKRAKLDGMAEEAMAEVLQSDRAKGLYDSAVAHAVSAFCSGALRLVSH